MLIDIHVKNEIITRNEVCSKSIKKLYLQQTMNERLIIFGIVHLAFNASSSEFSIGRSISKTYFIKYCEVAP